MTADHQPPDAAAAGRDARIAELRWLWERTTPGQWRTFGSADDGPLGIDGKDGLLVCSNNGLHTSRYGPWNNRFIARAHEYMPWLLDRLHVAETRADAAEAWAARWGAVARRYRRMLAVHRDRDRPALATERERADRLAVALADLMGMLRSVGDDAQQPAGWVFAVVDCWARGVPADVYWRPEAQRLYAILAADPDIRGAVILEAGTVMRALLAEELAGRSVFPMRRIVAALDAWDTATGHAAICTDLGERGEGR